MKAVILAGGKGTRLAPFTTILPKPLMPIGDYPILEVVIRQLKRAGFNRITMAVGHLGELIEAFFRNGEKWGIGIDYSREDKPLGTAGPLGIMDGLKGDFLVMNGDILTDLDFKVFMDYHRKNGAVATIGVFDKKVKIDLGVVKMGEEYTISDYVEKPELAYQVSDMPPRMEAVMLISDGGHSPSTLSKDDVLQLKAGSQATVFGYLTGNVDPDMVDGLLDFELKDHEGSEEALQDYLKGVKAFVGEQQVFTVRSSS